MLASFWESVGKGLSEKWLERIFGPAFLFWAVGLLLWVGPENLPARWNEFGALPVVAQSALLIGALLVLVASDRLMESFSVPLLHLLEGYWPGPLARLAEWLAARRQKHAARKKRRWSDLMLKRKEQSLTWAESRELARLEAWRAYTPRDLEDVMPTRLGDILRTAETRPYQRYGLDAVLLWPRLWPLLPENVRNDLIAARDRLDRRVQAFGWGFLFLIWVFAWHWAWVIAVLWMLVAWGLMEQAACTFTDLLLAAFDTHRWALYESLRWPLPEQSGATEIAAGEALTRFIQRGMTDAPVVYCHKESGE